MTDGLPGGWSRTTLAEVAEVRLGRQRSPKNHHGSHMRPYLRAANVSWSGLNLTGVKEMNFESAESGIYNLLPGDVLLVEASGSADEVGKAAIWRSEIEGCCFQNTLLRVRSYEILPEYLLHLLRCHALMGDFGRAARGVGIHHLGAGTLSAWPVVVPPLSEQRLIVSFVEEQISRIDHADGLLARARMSAVLAHSQALAGTTPPLAACTTLGEIADVVGGVTKDSKKQSNPTFVEVPYLRVANVQRGYLELREVATIRVPPEKLRKLRLEPGDILFNEGGDRDKLGRGWVWNGEVADCIHQNHVFRARLRTSDFDPKFVSMHGNSFGQRWFEKMGRQTTNLASINLKTLKSFPIPAIPVDEQRRIVAEIERKVTVLDHLLSAIDHAQRQSANLRRAILATAFRGELVPQDPTDEPASELLARIAAERPAPTRRTRKKNGA